MSSILSQDEISALLHGLPVKEGAAPVAAPVAAAMTAGEATTAALLDGLAGRCARLCAASMEEDRGRLLELEPLPVRLCAFGQAAERIREASCCCAVSLDDTAGMERPDGLAGPDGPAWAGGPGLLALDRALVFSLLEVFLAGSGRFERPAGRPLTALETMLADKFAGRFLAAFGRAGRPGARPLRRGRSLSLPRLALLTPDDEPVWQLAFRAGLEGRSGNLYLCLPEGLVRQLTDVRGDGGRDQKVPEAAGASGT